MLAELVRTTTSDGVRLDGALHQGALHEADSGADRPLPIDAIVCLHGVGANFYGSTLFEDILPAFLDRGVAVLRVNTRGHDRVSIGNTTGGPVQQGAAYEVVGQCRYDVRAWIDFLAQRGFQHVGLMGHSLGAIKAIYAEAHDPHTKTGCLIAISPPRLSYAAFQNGPQSSKFQEAISTARRHVEAGQPGQLFQARFPFPLLITAAGYLDKYGPTEQYNILKFADRLTCPTLVVFGTEELEHGGVAFAGLPEALNELRHPQQVLECLTVEDADHFYTGVRTPLAEGIVQWLGKMPG